MGMNVWLSLVALDCCCGDGRGADVNDKTSDGSTPLHCSSRFPQLVRLLLEKGANPNVVNGFGGTPLSYACGIPDSLHALLDGGALVMFGGKSVLRSACFRGHTESVKVLLRRRGFLRVLQWKYGSGETAREAASRGGQDAIVGLLDAALPLAQVCSTVCVSAYPSPLLAHGSPQIYSTTTGCMIRCGTVDSPSLVLG